MNKAINLKAIKWDVQQAFEQSSYAFKNVWFTASLIFIFIMFHGAFENLLVVVTSLIAITFQLKRHTALKNKEKNNEVIFFKKKKNERERNLYIFFTAMFFVWIFRGGSALLLFSFAITVFYLFKYLFYIPSIIFKAEDYSLIIEKGFQQKRIDFTYTNRIRFVSHRMIFENVLDKKIEVKDVEYLSKIDELKEFLSMNFGREKVVSAANGQPLI